MVKKEAKRCLSMKRVSTNKPQFVVDFRAGNFAGLLRNPVILFELRYHSMPWQPTGTYGGCGNVEQKKDYFLITFLIFSTRSGVTGSIL